jgi:AraC-like DNA-binding protein
MTKIHQIREISDFLNIIKLPLRPSIPGFIVYSYKDVNEESWIDLQAFRQNYFEISLEITKGCSFKVDQFSYSPEGHRVSFISPQRLLSVEAYIQYQYAYQGFTIFFQGDFINTDFTNTRFLKEYPFFSHFNSPFINLDDKETTVFTDVFEKIHYEYTTYGMAAKEIIKNYLNILLLFGKRNYNKHLEEKSIPGREQEIYQEFERLVQQYFLELDAVKDYADKIHISPKHLSETIRKVSGENALDIIHKAQLNHAKALLLQTNMTVAQIANALNFRDANYFSTFFKRLNGNSPLQFRNS